MYKPDEIVNKDVSAIIIESCRIGVAYYVLPYVGAPEEATIYRANKPHEDFQKAFEPIPDIAKKWLEFELTNADGDECGFSVRKIKISHSEKNGFGVSITCNIYKLTYTDEAIKISTPTYWTNGKGSGIDKNGQSYHKQLLTEQELLIFRKFATEAFKYAYYDKCEQPTVEEAADAEANGGFKDEEE